MTATKAMVVKCEYLFKVKREAELFTGSVRASKKSKRKREEQDQEEKDGEEQSSAKVKANSYI